MNHVLEGTWNEVSKEAAKLSGTTLVRLEVLDEKPKGTLLKFGALRACREITDEDFKAAEHSPKPWEG